MTEAKDYRDSKWGKDKQHGKKVFKSNFRVARIEEKICVCKKLKKMDYIFQSP